MRDRLKFSKWVNMPLRNPTQTRYRRFVKMPYGEMKSGFSESGERFKGVLKKALKTRYSELWEESR